LPSAGSRQCRWELAGSCNKLGECGVALGFPFGCGHCVVEEDIRFDNTEKIIFFKSALNGNQKYCIRSCDEKLFKDALGS